MSTPTPTVLDYPRTFVAADADLGDWPQIEPHFERLAERPLETVADVQQWLDDWSELDAGIAEARAERYVAMTCHTMTRSWRSVIWPSSKRLPPVASRGGSVSKNATHRARSPLSCPGRDMR